MSYGKGVLYVIACAAPPASELEEFVKRAISDKWQVCVITTPSGRQFVNSTVLTEITGFPVRTEYKRLGQQDILPKPDVLAIIPATFSTINKLALGIADNLALSTTCEALGNGTPVVVVPCLKQSLAKHPAFPKSIRLLKKQGVIILYEPKLYPSPQIVPYEKILSTLDSIPRLNTSDI